MVTSLTEDCFLQAFHHFASRKSLPEKMISDNASTYLSAAEELKGLFLSLSLKEAFSRRGVDWQFIPKRVPWYGGFWVKSWHIYNTSVTYLYPYCPFHIEGVDKAYSTCSHSIQFKHILETTTPKNHSPVNQNFTSLGSKPL